MHQLNYESGQLGNVLCNDNENVDQVLFALIFLCDSKHFYSYSLNMADRYDKKWLPRIALIRAAKQFTDRNYESAKTQINSIVENALCMGNMDDFYVSLFRYLQILTNISEDFGNLDFAANSSLIGDSHTISLSKVWNATSSDIYYLPGMTLRGLSFPLKNSYTSALESAIIHSQRKDKVIFSIGEIDSRNIYQYSRKYKDIEGFELATKKIINTSLGKIFSYKAPYQKYYIFSLPGFRPSLLPDLPFEEVEKIESLYHIFRSTFLSDAENIGFNVIDHNDMFETKHNENLIDHAHFHPGFFNKILNGFFS